MSDLYHKAARDGVLELLKTATKRDANRRDEDGMTPVHYASSCGNVEALRLLVSKGGDPDRPNQDGSTALHLAASCGQLNCLSFLTNFGANIWALDNEGRTALEEGALRGRMECVRHLDGLIAIHMMHNQKNVERQRKHAKKAMMKRNRKQEKNIQSREIEYEKKVVQETRQRSKSEINGVRGSWATNGTTLLDQNYTGNPFSELTSGGFDESSNTPEKESIKSNSSKKFRSIRAMGALRSKFSSLRGSNSDPKILGQRSLNDSGMFEDMSIRSPSFLDRLESTAVESQVGSLSSDSNDPFEAEESDLAYGHVVKNYDNKGNITTHVHYELKDSAKSSNGSVASRTTHSSQRSNLSSSLHDIHSLKSIELEDTYSQSDMGVDNIDTKSLVTFMASLNLELFTPFLVNESIDLNTLTLCSDTDLKDIGFPLGPRRKLLDAVKKRTMAINHPGPMSDSKI